MKKTRIILLIFTCILILMQCSKKTLALKTNELNRLEGTINNKYPIAMKFKIEGEEIYGYYYYKKIKKLIFIKGTVKDNNTEIIEYGKYGSQNGKFVGSIKDSKIVGQWYNLNKKNKKFPFELQEATGILIPYYKENNIEKIGYSGSYEYGNETDGGGELKAIQIAENKYKYNLEIVMGPPRYHIGTAEGEFLVSENIGKHTFSLIDDCSCTLYFIFSHNNLIIHQKGSDADCGFGANVYANNIYKKTRTLKANFNYSDKKFDLTQEVNKLKDGDTLEIPEGTYNISDSLAINNKKDIKIIGNGNCEIILDKEYLSVFDINHSKNITIENIKAQHDPDLAGNSPCIQTVIYIYKCNNVTLKDNHLNGCGRSGFSASYSEDLVVKNCKLFNNSSCAAELDQCNNVTLSDINIYDNKVNEIKLYECENVVEDNIQFSK